MLRRLLLCCACLPAACPAEPQPLFDTHLHYTSADAKQLDPGQIIELLREFYRRFEASPANRALVKFAARELGPEKGRSIYLMSLFPGSPAKLGSKIAGLPKPTGCV